MSSSAQSRAGQGCRNGSDVTEHLWGLHHRGALVARLRETGTDMPWVHAVVEELPAFDLVRSLFIEQESAVAARDVDRIAPAYQRIREAVTMTSPDGTPVAEFNLHIDTGGTARWRWSDRPYRSPHN